MKVAVAVVALISSAIAIEQYGVKIDQPNKFDPLDDGYPSKEKLAVIDNFGVGLAVPHRKTKFSPVRYIHPHANGGDPHGGDPHGGDPHGVNPHGSDVNPHDIGVNPYDSGVNPHAGNNGKNQGYDNITPFNNQGQGFNSFNKVGNIQPHLIHPPPANDGNNNNIGYGNQGNSGKPHAFGSGGLGKFGLSPKGLFDGRLHRVEKPTLPHTGHVIDTDNVHIGVPLASKPVHSPLKGYPSHPPIKRIPLRNLDLGAHAVDFKNDIKGGYGPNPHGSIIDPHFNKGLLKGSVHGTPLQFPEVRIAIKDSFKDDEFFNGKFIPSTGYNGNQGQGNYH